VSFAQAYKNSADHPDQFLTPNSLITRHQTSDWGFISKTQPLSSHYAPYISRGKRRTGHFYFQGGVVECSMTFQQPHGPCLGPGAYQPSSRKTLLPGLRGGRHHFAMTCRHPRNTAIVMGAPLFEARGRRFYDGIALLTALPARSRSPIHSISSQRCQRPRRLLL